jgi:hypothetical protein
MAVTETVHHGAAAGQLNEQAFIEMWLAELALDNSTRFDPDMLVKTIFSDRLSYGSPNPTQTRDYVLHCVRNAPHVCRHAIETGVYALHVEPECGPTCKTAWAKRQPLTGPLCTDCYTYKTPTGACLC